MEKRRLLRRRSCNIGQHDMLQVLSENPPLYLCPICEQYLGDEKGLQNYGPDRPMLPEAS